jgi:hypothetical protein
MHNTQHLQAQQTPKQAIKSYNTCYCSHLVHEQQCFRHGCFCTRLAGERVPSSHTSLHTTANRTT